MSLLRMLHLTNTVLDTVNTQARFDYMTVLKQSVSPYGMHPCRCSLVHPWRRLDLSVKCEGTFKCAPWSSWISCKECVILLGNVQ